MMTSKSHVRGHEVEFIDNQWVYSDTKEPTILNRRNCKKCKRPPTKDGHDACLGKLKGVTSACCGHGIEKDKIIVYGGDEE